MSTDLTAQPFTPTPDVHPSNVIVSKLIHIQDDLLRKEDQDLYDHLLKMDIAPQIYGMYVPWLFYIARKFIIFFTLGCMFNYTMCGAWWPIGRFDAFRPKGLGFESCSIRHVGTLGQVLHSQLPVVFWRETLTQNLCCVKSASE